jgi:hypothetical protein
MPPRRVVLDENIDVRFAREIPDHFISTVRSEGWTGVANGKLLRLIEAAEFDVFVTADRNLEYQQTLSNRAFGTVVLFPERLKLDHLRPLIPELVRAIQMVSAGEILRIRPPA